MLNSIVFHQFICFGCFAVLSVSPEQWTAVGSILTSVTLCYCNQMAVLKVVAKLVAADLLVDKESEGVHL